jgi:hypothetical protein
MKHLKRFNESIEEQIYKQVLNSIRECFLEFEDNGWNWIISPTSVYGREQSDISVWQNPNFNCRMINKEESDPRNWGKKNDSGFFIDWTGKITSDGEIVWESKDLTDSKFNNITEGHLMEEAQDFLVAIKRIGDKTGLDFNFSYNNRGGESRIIIQGRI